MSDFIYSPPSEQLLLLLYSVCVGIGVGIVYSFFDTIYIVADLYVDKYKEKEVKNQPCEKNKTIISKIFQFSIDFFFSIVYTIIIVVFVFCANNGKYRLFMMLFGVLGFIIYKITVGRLVSFLMRKLFELVQKAIRFIIIFPVVRLVLFIFRMLDAVFASNTIKKGIIKSLRKDVGLQ